MNEDCDKGAEGELFPPSPGEKSDLDRDLGLVEDQKDGGEMAKTIKLIMTELNELKKEIKDMKEPGKRKRKVNETFSREEVEMINEELNNTRSSAGKKKKVHGTGHGSYTRSLDCLESRSDRGVCYNAKRDSNREHSKRGQCITSSHANEDDVLSLCAEEELELFLDEDTDNNYDDNSEEDVLVELEKEIDEENKKGPDINQKLAKVIMARFSSRLNDDVMKNKLGKYCLPQNCEIIAPPKLNEEMMQAYVGLKKNAKRDDGRLTQVQRLIAKATTAVALGTEKLHTFSTSASVNAEMKKVANQVMGNALDAIAFLGNAQLDLTLRRKYQMMKELPFDIRSICHQKTDRTESDKLFGEDVTKQMKEARDAHKLAQLRQRTYTTHYGTGRKPFLFGRGRGNMTPSTTRYAPYKKRGEIQSGRK